MKSLSKILLVSGIGISLLNAIPIIEPMNNIIQSRDNVVNSRSVLIYPIKGDIDGDGIENSEDAFPANPNEWLYTDKDGIGNNADNDDDNDGMKDNDEIHYGFDPLDPNDATMDADGDGISNLKEIENGTNPLGDDIIISSIYEETSYDLWEEVSHIDNGNIIIKRAKDQTVTCRKIHNHKETKVISEVEGTLVLYYKDGKVDFFLPFNDATIFRVTNNGEVILSITNAIVPSGALPAGTTVLIKKEKTEIIIPLSKLSHIRFKKEQ
jgi:hypothetical protein